LTKGTRVKNSEDARKERLGKYARPTKVAVRKTTRGVFGVLPNKSGGELRRNKNGWHPLRLTLQGGEEKKTKEHQGEGFRKGIGEGQGFERKKALWRDRVSDGP